MNSVSRKQKDGAAVIVGAGQAGASAAKTLRDEGFEGRIVLIGEEQHPPYERPPLSKALLTGARPEASVMLMDRDAACAASVDLRLATRVLALDPGRKTVTLEGGEEIGFDKALLATGLRPKRLPFDDGRFENVVYLRTLDDARRLRIGLPEAERVVIAGGGYIGLEVASSASKMGCAVTVLESAPEIMMRGVAPEVAAVFRAIHADEGVRIETGVRIDAFEGRGAVHAVRTADGRRFAADLVVVGIGAQPASELAKAAGLAVADGIVADQFGRTSHPGIFAAGDAALHWNALAGRAMRPESWQAAQNQAINAAVNMCGGNRAYGDVPYFWTEQHGHTLQMLRLGAHHDETVIRGSLNSRDFAMFQLDHGRIAAAYILDRPRDAAAVRMLMESAAAVTPTELADENTPLKRLARAKSAQSPVEENAS
jgi:3-phenylpropionate/trans-cinnamate dioxygenase ferredoxin reductase subunit